MERTLHVLNMQTVIIGIMLVNCSICPQVIYRYIFLKCRYLLQLPKPRLPIDMFLRHLETKYWHHMYIPSQMSCTTMFFPPNATVVVRSSSAFCSADGSRNPFRERAEGRGQDGQEMVIKNPPWDFRGAQFWDKRLGFWRQLHFFGGSMTMMWTLGLQGSVFALQAGKLVEEYDTRMHDRKQAGIVLDAWYWTQLIERRLLVLVGSCGSWAMSKRTLNLCQSFCIATMHSPKYIQIH